MSAENQPIHTGSDHFRHVRVIPDNISDKVPNNVTSINALREPTPPAQPRIQRLFTATIDQLANRKHKKRNIVAATAITVGTLFGPHIVNDAKADSKVPVTTTVKMPLDK